MNNATHSRHGRELNAREWLSPKYQALFWAKVDKSGGPQACWHWTGARAVNGYGVYGIFRNGQAKAHRIAWSLENGVIPEHLMVCHHCDNPPCCNPAHLYAGTHLDNVADKVRRGRQSHQGPYRPLRGEQDGNSKLTEREVIEIRVLHNAGVSYQELSRKFGVHPQTAYMVATRRSWAHVLEPADR